MDFDKIDKEILKKDRTEIPKSFNNKIDKVLMDLDKKKNNNLKKIVMVASFVLCVGIGGIKVVAVEKGISVKEVIIEMFGFEGGKEKYITPVGEEIEKSGIKVKIDSVVYDGYTVKFGYTIKTKENIKNLREDMKFKIEREDGGPNVGWYRSRNEIVDENTIIGVYSWNLEIIQFEDGKRIEGPENLDLKFKINCNGEEFDFKMKVDELKLREDCHIYNVNKPIKDGVIEKIVTTPMSVKLYVEGNEKLYGKIPEYVIEDNTGIKERFQFGDSTIESKATLGEYEYKNNFKDLSKIKLYKIKDIVEGEGYLNIKDGEIETNIDENKAGFKITDVKINGNITEIYYDTEDPLLVMLQIEDFYCFDEKAIDKNTGVIILKKLEKNKKYKVKYEVKKTGQQEMEIDLSEEK